MDDRAVHSPVLDVNMNPENPEINIRAFGDDPEIIAEYSKAYSQGLMYGGIVVRVMTVI